MRTSTVLVAATLGAATLLGACSGSDDTVESDPLGEAVIAPARRTLVPSELPDGMMLQLVDEDSGGESGGYVRLYGPEDSTGPLEGSVLVAMWQWFEGDGDLPTGDTRSRLPPNETTPFWGQQVVSGSAGSARWNSWLVPNGTEAPGSAGVVGREVTEDALSKAAENLEIVSDGLVDGELHLDAQPPPFGVDWFGSPRLDPAPAGMVELASGHVSLSGLQVEHVPTAGSVLQWSRNDSRLTVATYEHDDALALLLRTGVDDPDGTLIRGHAGAHGSGFAPSRHGADRPTELWTWTEDGMDVMVIAVGMDTSIAQRAVDSLRPSDDWAGLITEASAPPSRSAAADELLLQDGFPGGSWTISIVCHPDDRTVEGWSCLEFENVRHAEGSNGSGGGGSMYVVDADLTIRGDANGTLIHGTAPTSITSIEVDLAEGRTLRPELRRGPTGWPIRAWATWVDDPAAVVTDVRGFDASGTQRFSGVAADLVALGQPAEEGGSSGIRIVTAP